MYVVQLENGRTIITDATNKMAACQALIDMSKAGELVARLLQYTGKCHCPTVTVIITIDLEKD